MTIIGVAVAQIAVNPTMSLNSIVTSGYVFASIVSPAQSTYQYLLNRVFPRVIARSNYIVEKTHVFKKHENRHRNIPRSNTDRNLPSHKRFAISGGNMRCRRLTFFSLSTSTAKFASSMELFNLSIRLLKPSWKEVTLVVFLVGIIMMIRNVDLNYSVNPKRLMELYITLLIQRE